MDNNKNVGKKGGKDGFKKVPLNQLKSQAKEVDEFIKNSLKEIRTVDNLGDYEVHYRFSAKSKSRGHKTVAAEIAVDNVYKNVNIILRPEIIDFYKAGDKETIKKILCHELSHIRVEPLAKLAFDRFAGAKEINEAVETITEHYGRLLYSKMEAKKEVKKETKVNDKQK